MSRHPKRSITLLELLITIVILGFLIIGLSSIDTFSHSQQRSADRRSRIQNALSYSLEHMAKHISKGLGDLINNAVTITDLGGGDNRIQVYIDANQDGQRNDYEIAYQSSNYTLRYYANYTGAPSSYETIARYIKNFSPAYTNTTNYVEVNSTLCWDAANSSTCGTIDNPQMNMRSRIHMPGVTTN